MPDPSMGPWLRGFWRSLRPEFWAVTIFPLYTGWMLAARELFPGLGVWVALGQRAATAGVTPAEVGVAFAAWWGEAWPFLGALACVGPLVWGAVLLSNNYWDLEADRTNPRRARDPMVLGIVTAPQALWGSRLLAAAGVAVTALVGPLFLGVTLACLLLSWAYSAPPLHLKARAGFDVAVNVLGIGVLCTLGGWGLAAPVETFPWPFLVLPVLLLASCYIPTTLVDYPTDKAFGLNTIAVALGPSRAFWVGFGFAVASNAVFLLCALLDYVVSWRVYRWVWPTGVAELLFYLGMRRWDNLAAFLRGLVGSTLAFGLGMTLFILDYTGWVRL